MNHKIPIVFYSLKNYDSYLIMLGKFDFRISVIPNVWKRCMCLNINNKLIFFDSFEFLRSSLDNLVKNLGKDNFKCLSQEFDGKLLDLLKQENDFLLMSTWVVLKSSKKIPSRKRFYSLLTGKKLGLKRLSMFLCFDKDERLSQLILKIGCFIVSWCVGKIKNTSLEIMDYVWAIIWLFQLEVEMQRLICEKLSLNLYQMQKCIHYLRKVW